MNEGLRRMDDERIAKLEERVANFMTVTVDYRKELCAKLDRIIKKIDDLPCPARVEQTKSIRFQLNIFWWLLGITLPSLIGLAVAAGSLKTTVDHDTEIIHRLTQTSYGYRGVDLVKREDIDNLAKEIAQLRAR